MMAPPTKTVTSRGWPPAMEVTVAIPGPSSAVTGSADVPFASVEVSELSWVVLPPGIPSSTVFAEEDCEDKLEELVGDVSEVLSKLAESSEENETSQLAE